MSYNPGACKCGGHHGACQRGEVRRAMAMASFPFLWMSMKKPIGKKIRQEKSNYKDDDKWGPCSIGGGHSNGASRNKERKLVGEAH